MTRVVFGMVLGAALAAVSAVTAQEAAPMGTDGLKRQLTDACIIEIWRRPEMVEVRETAVRRCQCATNKVFKELKPEEMASVSYTRPLVGPARNAVLAALSSCGV